MVHFAFLIMVRMIAGDYKPLSIDDVKALAKEGVSKSTELITEAHLSLTGASGKVGLYYDRGTGYVVSAATEMHRVRILSSKAMYAFLIL